MAEPARQAAPLGPGALRLKLASSNVVVYGARVQIRGMIVAGLLGAAVTVTGSARALESQWQAGADVGYAAVSYGGSVHSGFGGGAHLTYGLTDSFNALADLTATTHGLDEGLSRLQVLSASAGIAYTLDIIQWVPYAGLLVGGYRLSGGAGDAEGKLGLQGAFGLDYRLSRSWSLGAQVRYHTFTDDLMQAHYVTAFLRAEYVWMR